MGTLRNPRHETFCQHRVAGKSAVQAYLAAGYKGDADKSGTRTSAARLQANADVKARITELQEEAAKEAVASGSRVLQEMTRLALSDIRQLFDANGRLLPVCDLEPEIAAAVSSVKVVTKTVPGTDPVEVEHVSEIKFWNKPQALDQLARHLRLYEPDDADKQDPMQAFAAALMAAARPIPVATQPAEEDPDE